MPDDKTAAEVTRQSSPRFPFISLAKAIERAEQLRRAASFGFALVADVRSVWGYGPKSSGGDQTVAALGYYGLTEETGAGNDRKIKLSELGARYLRDERPDVQRTIQEQMVQSPKAMQTLWDLWKRDVPSDAIARSILKNDLGYSDSAAAQVLSVYRDNLQYFPGLSSAKVPTAEKPLEENPDAENTKADGRARIGDYIQWSPNGINKFESPKRVVWVDREDGVLRVEGSMTGIPVNETSVVEQPKEERVKQAANADDDFSVLMTGSRLQISAEVDLEGLGRLKAILDKYEEILKLMRRN